MTSLSFLMDQAQALPEILSRRRLELTSRVASPILLWAGDRLSRNFRANHVPFRASSHFLYFAGLPLAGAVLYLAGDRHILFMDFPTADDGLWHGEFVERDILGDWLGVDEILATADLLQYVQDSVTIPLVDPWARLQQSRIFGRHLPEPHQLIGDDLSEIRFAVRQLAEAIIKLRLQQDGESLTQTQKAVDVSIKAHKIGLKIARESRSEMTIRGAIEGEFTSQKMTCAYNSIVTTHGEILHNEHSFHSLNSGELLLVDAGAETAFGWAADLTRTYPVNGKFSATQRDLYDIVLAAHDQAIAAIHPTVEFRELHWLAAKVLTEGLLDLGIFQGNVDDLLAHDAHALFFPHGLGHLLGLDVHDMEDLGDLAGYAPNRSRSDRFGECFLRCDRPLATGMVVTIEPGFYQIPALLNDPENRQKYQHHINWEKLAQFSDVRGIRIEDDILVTPSGAQNLSKNLPTRATDIENFMNS